MGGSKKSSSVRCCQCRNSGALLAVIVVASIVTACVGYFLIRPSPTAEPTLRFVSIIHRHGERAPRNSYPLDPYKDDSLWPDGLGNLLQKGKVSMYNFGQCLRHRYGGFLSSRYTPAETLVISMKHDRCIMSGELVLAGLYPPVGNQVWNPDLPWQPVPVHSLPASCDDMIRVNKHCPLLLHENKQREIFIQKQLEDHQTFLIFLSQKTGLQVKTVFDINDIYDNLLVVGQQGLPLPDWARDIYPDKINSLAQIDYMEFFKTPTMTRLESGVLINDILSNMKQKKEARAKFERRLKMYSAQDRTLLRVFRGMNMSQEMTEKPHYGAALIIELHEINDKFRVKVLYKKGTSEVNLSVLKTRGCDDGRAAEQDDFCDLDTFSSALQSVIITDFEEACKIPQH